MKTTLQLSALVLGLAGATSAFGQTVFSDAFGTSQGTSFTTSGAIGTSSWNVTRSGADWGARIHNGILELSNDASAATNADGWVFASVTVATFASPFTSTLAENPGLVTWTFNMRQIRTDPAGFGAANSYGVAFILAGSDTAAATTGNGYAIALGQSGPTDPIRIVRYTNGLRGTLTDIVVASAPLADVGAEYLSLSVTYSPSTNTWSLLGRVDGTSSFSDPASGPSLAALGSATDSTWTSVALGHMGAYWQGATAANQTAFFDNISVTVIPEPSAFAALAGLGAIGVVAMRRKRRAASFA